MDKLASMQAFTQVVAQGGFAAAARKMGVSRSTVNKLVINLEDQLQVQLLQRTTRKVTPTPTGLVYYEQCLNILAEIEAAETNLLQLQQEPKGTLKINAPMSFGTIKLGKAIANFLLQYPELQLQLTLDDRFIDPIAEGYDIVIRIAQPQFSPSLVTKTIAPIKRVFCASDKYIQKWGIPQQPQELRNHSCLHYGQLITGNQWHLIDKDGIEHKVNVRGTLCSNNGEVLKDAAIAGIGIALLPMFIVDSAVTQGLLKILDISFSPPEIELSIVYPLNRHLSIKVKAFIEFIENSLQPK